MPDKRFEQIKQLIAEDKIEEAIAYFKALELEGSFEKAFLQLQGGFHNFKNQSINGTLNLQEKITLRNQIRISLLDLLDQLENFDPSSVQEQAMEEATSKINPSMEP